MNMNKALQNLYHAVSNETTTKVNISKLLVDIHYAITGKESENKNNWSKIVNSMADNWPEGGGGGSSDFSTAEVTVVNTNESYEINVDGAFCVEENALGEGSPAMTYTYINTSEPETISGKIALYKGGCWIGVSCEDAPVTVSVSGSATLMGSSVYATGDCTITIS